MSDIKPFNNIPADMFGGKIWKTAETLIFDGTVEDHDAVTSA
jgi:hypothetical protein